MKKIILIILTVFLNASLFSCSTADADLDENPTEQSPGGEDGDILPEEDEDDGNGGS